MCGGMMLLLISGAISNSNAVIRQEFRKLRFQMIDDSGILCAEIESPKEKEAFFLRNRALTDCSGVQGTTGKS